MKKEKKTERVYYDNAREHIANAMLRCGCKSVAEFCDMHQLSRTSVYRAIKEDKITPYLYYKVKLAVYKTTDNI